MANEKNLLLIHPDLCFLRRLALEFIGEVNLLQSNSIEEAIKILKNEVVDAVAILLTHDFSEIEKFIRSIEEETPIFGITNIPSWGFSFRKVRDNAHSCSEYELSDAVKKTLGI
ncbi:MAG: hypothetical protein V1804_03790 [Patescibacteria group bacterium]